MAPCDLERQNWVFVECANGRTLCTNSYEQYAPGSRFLAVYEGDARLGWWLSESWGDPQRSAAVITEIFELAARGKSDEDPDYGTEWVIELADGAVELRVASAGTHIRAVDATQADGLLRRLGHRADEVYWLIDEWTKKPEKVLGAVLGLVCEVTAE